MSIKERVRQIVEMSPKDSCDVYDHLCVEFESFAREIRNEALEEAAHIAYEHAKNWDAGLGKWSSNDIGDQIEMLKTDALAAYESKEKQ